MDLNVMCIFKMSNLSKYQRLACLIFFQVLIKDPKTAGIVLNPHVKRSIKQKVFSDSLAKAKLSPLTVNLISEYSLRMNGVFLIFSLRQ